MEADNKSLMVELTVCSMTLEEKVAQMFLITPESLTATDNVTMAGDITREAYRKYPVGGIIYFENNIITNEQTREMLNNMNQISMERTGLPAFLALDEEGGSVCRVSGRLNGIPQIKSALEIAGQEEAYETGRIMGAYLRELGFNMDLAPVCDLLSNPENGVIGDRSFGTDPVEAGEKVSGFIQGLQEAGICTTLKHFPGHGDTSGDSHTGKVQLHRSLEELEKEEWIPFQRGILAGTDFVMVGHICLPQIVDDRTPATLSYEVVTTLLRETLGFDGIIITDAMNMGAIANDMTSAEASVRALEAGVDIVLMPADFKSAYQAVLEAVREGRISEERIDQSAGRIVAKKIEMRN